MSELPDELFDGYAVFCSLTDRARKRTSDENVSDVLDALAKLMKARRPSISPSPPSQEMAGMTLSEEQRSALLSGHDALMVEAAADLALAHGRERYINRAKRTEAEAALLRALATDK